MSKYLDGASLFTTMNSGLTNTFSVLSSSFTDGITLSNLKSNDATKALTANGIGTNFKSYLQTNFSSLDKDKDGVLSADELKNLTSSLTKEGMTIEQLYQLSTTGGISSSLLETVVTHFNEIDKNKDGKVSNAEIQAYGVESSLEERKNADTTNIIKQMSTFYDSSSSVSDDSLLDYRYLSSSSSSNSISET